MLYFVSLKTRVGFFENFSGALLTLEQHVNPEILGHSVYFITHK